MCSKIYEFEQIPDFLLSPDFVFLLNHFLCVTDRNNGTDHWPIVYVRVQSDSIQSRRFMVGPWHSVMDQYLNLITTLSLNFRTLFQILSYGASCDTFIKSKKQGTYLLGNHADLVLIHCMEKFTPFLFKFNACI